MDLASVTSEQLTESDDNFSEINTTWILLELRKDVKKMNKIFDHLETSVRQLKRDSKILKDQNVRLMKQVSELKSSVSKLESQNKEQEMKTECLVAQSRHDNPQFYGFGDKSDESWEESETRVRNYFDEHLNIDEDQIKRPHRIRPMEQTRGLLCTRYSGVTRCQLQHQCHIWRMNSTFKANCTGSQS